MRRITWQAVCLLHLLAGWTVGQLPDDAAKANESQAAVARALAEALKDPDVEVRRSAVLSLGRIGSGAEPATAPWSKRSRMPMPTSEGLPRWHWAVSDQERRARCRD